MVFKSTSGVPVRRAAQKTSQLAFGVLGRREMDTATGPKSPHHPWWARGTSRGAPIAAWFVGHPRVGLFTG